MPGSKPKDLLGIYRSSTKNQGEELWCTLGHLRRWNIIIYLFSITKTWGVVNSTVTFFCHLYIFFFNQSIILKNLACQGAAWITQRCTVSVMGIWIMLQLQSIQSKVVLHSKSTSDQIEFCNFTHSRVIYDVVVLLQLSHSYFFLGGGEQITACQSSRIH